MNVGLSISEGPDLASLGLGPEHLRDAMVEFARHLLVAGHTLSYGGHLRPDSFMVTLREVALAHTTAETEPRIANYLAWPNYKHVPTKQLAETAATARLWKCAAPPEATADGETAYTTGRGLNEMRRRMNDEIGARLLLGGKRFGFSGLLPGLAEEALLALEANKPLYLIGAFGGCTRLIIDGIRKRTCPPGLQEDAFAVWLPETGVAQRLELVGLYAQRRPEAPTFRRLGLAFERNGVDELSEFNGLSVEENELLFTTPDLPVLVGLVLKGLSCTTRLGHG